MPQQISNGAEGTKTVDRAPAEMKIRSLALQTALASNRVLPEGECDRIVALACGQLTPEQLRTGQIGADVFARVAEMTQKALEVGPVNYISSPKAQVEARTRQDGAEGRLVNGQWVSGKAADGVGGRVGYQSLSINDGRALQSVTAQNFGASPFAAAGIDYSTFAYLRGQGPFSAQNILTAANDTRALGFTTTDRAAMLDHAIIDRFDPKARHTNAAMQDYQRRLEGDEELGDLHQQRKSAKTPEQRKTLDAQIAAKRARHSEESGLTGRIDDPAGHPKAVKATKSRKTAIEKKAEHSYAPNTAPKQKTEASNHSKTKANAELFKQLTASPK